MVPQEAKALETAMEPAGTNMVTTMEVKMQDTAAM
jgi:hypothetical protein